MKEEKGVLDVRGMRSDREIVGEDGFEALKQRTEELAPLLMATRYHFAP